MTTPCVLGSARITGQYVTFVPEPAIVAVRAGQEVEIGVRFDYVEASHGKEHCELTFELEHPEDGAKTVRVRVGDRPMMRDELLGFLAQKARFHKPGDHRVRFALKVDTQHGSWFGGASDGSRAKHEGEVLVRVT